MASTAESAGSGRRPAGGNATGGSSVLGGGTAKKRKRSAEQRRQERREKLKQYGVDLPEIPGLPIELIPIHVHALKKTTKFFQHQTPVTVFSPYDDDDDGAQDDEKRRSAADYSITNAGGEQLRAVGPATAARSARETADDDPLASVFRQIDESAGPSSSSASSDATATLRRRQARDRATEMSDAVAAWLDAIRRLLRDGGGGGGRNGGSSSGKRRPSVAAAAFGHLWEMCQSHHRVTVRRASFHLASRLLQKSADCRRLLLGDDDCPRPCHQGVDPSSFSSSSSSSSSRLVDWMDSVISGTGGDDPAEDGGDAVATNAAQAASSDGNGNDRNDNEARARCFRRESYLLLLHLDESGYGELYPILPIAIQRFQQTCPDAASPSAVDREAGAFGGDTSLRHHGAAATTTPSSSSTATMDDWRRYRDIALEFHDKEEVRVHKLVQRCHECMDILVPRIGEEQSRSTATVTSLKATNPDDAEDGDDDDSVDWEDGWGGEGDDAVEAGASPASEGQEAVSHTVAVERTMEAMQSTGGIQAGKIEISFQPREDDFLEGRAARGVPAPMDVSKLEARAKLEKWTRILSSRHMPLLTSWVDGLTKADGLTRSEKSASSLVSLPIRTSRRRKGVLEKVLEMKRAVAAVLASASKLGLDSSRLIRRNTDGNLLEAAAASSGDIINRPQPRRTIDLLGNGRDGAGTSSAARVQSRADNMVRRRRLSSPRDITRSRSKRIHIKYRKKLI